MNTIPYWLPESSFHTTHTNDETNLTNVSWKLSNLGTATTGALQAALTSLIAATAAKECIQTSIETSLLLAASLNVIIVRHLLLCWCRTLHFVGVEEDVSSNSVRPIFIYKLKHRKLLEHV